VSGEVRERHAPWVVSRLVRGTDMRGWGGGGMERGSQQMEHNFSRIKRYKSKTCMEKLAIQSKPVVRPFSVLVTNKDYVLISVQDTHISKHRKCSSHV
jgi:hypothetical protein